MRPILYKFLFAIVVMVSPAAYAYEPTAKPILRINLGDHTDMIRAIATDRAGRYLVTASHDKTAKIWDATDGHLISTLRIPLLRPSNSHGSLTTVALSPDGSTVALGGDTGFEKDESSVFIFDRASGRLSRHLEIAGKLCCQVTSLAFSPDGETLAVLLHDGLFLYSVNDGQLLAEDHDGFIYSNWGSVNFSSDGRLIVKHDRLMHLYRFEGHALSLFSKVANGFNSVSSLSSDGKFIASAMESEINILNANTLEIDHVLEGVKSTEALAWSQDGKFLYAGGTGQRDFGGEFRFYVRRLPNGKKGAPTNLPLPQGSNSVFSMAALPKGKLAYAGAGPVWGVFNANGSSQIFHASESMKFIGGAITLAEDGARVGFNGFLGKSPTAFDVMNRIYVRSDDPVLLAPRIKSSALEITDVGSRGKIPKLNGVTIKDWDGFFVSYCFALSEKNNNFVIGGTEKIIAYDQDRNKKWTAFIAGNVYAITYSQDNRWVVAAYADGTIRWHRASDGAEQLAFFPHADKKRWVLWTPSGYYDASLGAEDLIGWHLNRGKDHEADFFPASRFRERFYRPDVISKVLETQDEAEAVHLANEASGRRTQGVTAIAQALPPVVEIVSPACDSTVQPGKITVRYRVRTAADAPVTAMRVRVNGLLQSDTRALKRVADNSDDVREIEVNIPAQDAEIQLFAENKFSTSTPAILRLQVAGGKAASKQASSSKPKLYVLAVGVSKYANPEYNLGLASKDANDFVNSLKGQKGKLYSDVLVRLLTDAQATKDDVLDGLDWLKQNVTANDVGVMFVAGHGMNDKLGGYYFMPHNADPDKLARTGVSQADIKQTFANLPGHTVFFIDTCYSGGVMGNVRTSGFVNDLASAENGAVVFTASSAGQLSQENSSWGNGAFTKSVVEGLNGKADAFNSGAVTVKGLDFYVDGRVKSLTNGQQTPVSIAPGGLSDFPLAGIGK